MTLYIIRHGETDMNRQGIVQGCGVDSELNLFGQKQARLFYQYYKNVHFDFIITSNLKRTHQTVEPFIQRGTHLQWIKKQELNEISWGIHEGQVGDTYSKQNYQKLMNDWNAGIYETKIEGGESAAELHARVTQVVDFIKDQQFSKKNILLCTHGRTLLCLLTVLNGHPLSKMNTFRHQNTCLYKVHYVEGEFIFEVENDIRHLGTLQTVGF